MPNPRALGAERAWGAQPQCRPRSAGHEYPARKRRALAFPKQSELSCHWAVPTLAPGHTRTQSGESLALSAERVASRLLRPEPVNGPRRALLAGEHSWSALGRWLGELADIRNATERLFADAARKARPMLPPAPDMRLPAPSWHSDSRAGLKCDRQLGRLSPAAHPNRIRRSLRHRETGPISRRCGTVLLDLSERLYILIESHGACK